MILLSHLLPSLLLVGSVTGYRNVPMLCSSGPPGEPTEVLDAKMKITASSVQMRTISTDWVRNRTMQSTETRDGEVASVRVNNNGQVVQILNWAGKNFSINSTDNSCAERVNVTVPDFFTPTSELNMDFGVSPMVNRIVELSTEHKGYYNGTHVRGGVECVEWISCSNTTEGFVQTEVWFSGANSFTPPFKDFTNPQMLYFRVTFFSNFTENGTVISSQSHEINYSPVEQQYLQIPPATVCEGWTNSTLPLMLPEPFSGVVQRRTNGSQYTSQAKVLYSTNNRISAVCVDALKADDVVPFFNTKATVAGSTSFIHDFHYGYEYVLSDSRCVDLNALPSASTDVVLNNTIVTMKPLADLFITNFTTANNWGKYGNVTNVDGTTSDIYRSHDEEKNEIVEVHIGTGSIWSIVRYFKGSSTPISSIIITSAPIPSLTAALFRSHECFTGQTSSNNTYTFSLKGKSFSDVHQVGEERLRVALADALNKIAPINPERVSAFFETESNGNLGVIFTIDEKNTKEPAATPFFNYAEEVATTTLMSKLNETFSQGDWTFEVLNGDQKPETWTAAKQSLTMFPAPHSDFVGYPFGSLITMGVFSLFFGVAVGAGGLYYMVNRRNLSFSTMAYQIFE